MPVQTLTTQFITTLPTCQPLAGSVAYFDTEIKGFMLEHRASGGGTYYFWYAPKVNSSVKRQYVPSRWWSKTYDSELVKYERR